MISAKSKSQQHNCSNNSNKFSYSLFQTFQFTFLLTIPPIAYSQTRPNIRNGTKLEHGTWISRRRIFHAFIINCAFITLRCSNYGLMLKSLFLLIGVFGPYGGLWPGNGLVVGSCDTWLDNLEMPVWLIAPVIRSLLW